MRLGHLHQQVKQLTTRTHHFVPSVIKKLEKKVADINNDLCKSFKSGFWHRMRIKSIKLLERQMSWKCQLSGPLSILTGKIWPLLIRALPEWRERKNYDPSDFLAITGFLAIELLHHLPQFLSFFNMSCSYQ